ncbi:MAG TPA: MSMEG_0568 family radical SAM protein [Candidatus Bathyarchaeia archaeon]|nr:MSMEG_0568 family radical SAM protein [Candidatus Bathyarchaeia archaeon]
MNATRLKIELLCKGARVEEGIDRGRKAGAGPAGGRYFTLPNGTCIEIPLQGRFIETSPFRLIKADDHWFILRGTEPLTKVKPVQEPLFYEKKTVDGTLMKKVAILHGKDCLASTVYSKCVHWQNAMQCKFCAIELGDSRRLVVKPPQLVAEVAEEALKEGAATHVTLTTGTPANSSDRGASHLVEATHAVKKRLNLPVHVQLEPCGDKGPLERLFDAGVDTVGIHIEAFDRKVLSEVCPAKSDIKAYFNAWKKAVDLFGEGQVSTFVIAGLGESDESILTGAEKAARIGVVPYLLPLRPIPGTIFENIIPPDSARMTRLYRGVAETLRKVGLDPRKSKAGCVRCNACSALQESFTSPP